MTPLSAIVDLMVVGVSLVGSFMISQHTVNSRIDSEREREIEQWYVEAGIQADLASREYSNEILSETSTGNDAAKVLRDRASKLQEHAAEGRYLGVDEILRTALKEIAGDYRYIASEIDAEGTTDWSELTTFEDDMWDNVRIISKTVPSETEYHSDNNWWKFWS
jgi:Arc/MetJ-type ribon-helix-helix transcriptional regulator